MSADGWAAAHLPDLAGRVVVVTGANSGIGFHTARLLCRSGATLVLACRNTERADEAAGRLPGGALTGELDLSDQSSIAAFADELGRRVDRVDALVNSAGVMAIRRELTVDGFERQLATNHLGHAALTARLLPLLLAAPAPRVVTVTSFLARSARIRLEDLQGDTSYDPWAAYGQSKLANLLFGLELARRSQTAGGALASIVVHPGYSRTRLVANGPAATSTVADRSVLAVGGLLVAQSASAGALPSVLAAGGTSVANGDFVVPRGPGHLRGRPHPARPPTVGRDIEVAAALWDATWSLTGLSPGRL